MFLLFLAISGSALAQPVTLDRFVPVEEGNSWEYSVSRSSGDGEQTDQFEVFDVAADTTLSGSRYFVVHARRLDAERREISRWDCFVRIGPNGAPETREDMDGCQGATAFTSFNPVEFSLRYVDRVQIGDSLYDVAATASYDWHVSGPSGSGASMVAGWASDVGVYRHIRYSSAHREWGGGGSGGASTLVFARVGDRTFGKSILPGHLPADWPSFSPLSAGNRWLYRTESMATDAPAPFLEFKVSGDTLIGGEMYRLLGGRALNEHFQEISRVRWAFRLDAYGLTDRLVPLGGSAADHALPLLSLAYPSADVMSPQYEIKTFGAEIEVGWSIHSPGTLAVYSGSVAGARGNRAYVRREHVAGIGTARHLVEAGANWGWEARLVAAEVDGVSYGSWPGGGAPAARPRDVPLIATYPNPFQNEIHISFSGVGENVLRTEIFDVAGRRVLHEMTDVGGWRARISLSPGAPGLYVLRVTDGGGRQASVVLIRVPPVSP